MTLPRIVAQALQARYRKSTVRLVFPANAWRFERGDGERVIRTIGTGGGFDASFVLSRDELRSIADCAESVGGAGTATVPPRLN